MAYIKKKKILKNYKELLFVTVFVSFCVSGCKTTEKSENYTI